MHEPGAPCGDPRIGVTGLGLALSEGSGIAHHSRRRGDEGRTITRPANRNSSTNERLSLTSNAITEGQINRLKTLKRSMYGRAGTELLRARMLPLIH
jgi:hypothetical protein